MKRFYLFIGLVLGIQMGWFIAIQYSISVLNRKHDIIPIEDYSRLREIEVQLSKDRFLWF
jgi:hypothetical protein